MPFCKVKGTKIHYIDRGQGKNLLLLPGNTASSAVHENDISFFSGKGFRVICPDYPGYGRSDRLENLPDHFWWENAKVLIQLLSHLEIERTYLLGTSGGAIIGLNITIMAPDTVSAVVGDSFRVAFSNEAQVACIVSSREEATNEQTLFWRFAHGDDWKNVVKQDSKTLQRAAEKDLKLVRLESNRIECPTLLTGNLNDELIPDIVYQLTETGRKIPRSKVVFYARGKHPSMWTNAEKFRQDALFFLDRVSK